MFEIHDNAVSFTEFLYVKWDYIYIYIKTEC